MAWTWTWPGDGGFWVDTGDIPDSRMPWQTNINPQGCGTVLDRKIKTGWYPGYVKEELTVKDHIMIDNNPVTAGGNTSTLDSLVPLRTTTMSMHRIWFEISSLEQWYGIIRDANLMFGHGNWQGQRHVRRKIDSLRYARYSSSDGINVWFDVPDQRFGTWISIKHAVRMTKIANK